MRDRSKDVSNTIDVTDPEAVSDAVVGILGARYSGADLSCIPVLMADFARLYRGEYPGFEACDIGYHNMQHVLDVTLAMARLIDGHDKCHRGAQRLGAELAITGIACALFHDAGYIRRSHDTRARNGAEYTRIHVSRSARFMTEYLPTVGLEFALPACQRIVHFTGYEVNPNDISVPSQNERTLGWLLGTADLIAQMADVAYLEKCRDKLYVEFELGGMAGQAGSNSTSGVIYNSPAHLMQSTPNFIRSAIQVRLEGYFHSVYRYAAEHFDGPNLYMEAIYANCSQLEAVLAQNDPDLLMSDALGPRGE